MEAIGTEDDTLRIDLAGPLDLPDTAALPPLRGDLGDGVFATSDT